MNFARKLWQAWRRLELPAGAEKIIVAVSGGADSCALLAGLCELRAAGKLRNEFIVAHFNHRLRAAAEADEKWVVALANKLNCPALTGAEEVGKLAAKSGDNLEQAARRARYRFLTRAAGEYAAASVLTAHTLDDQAETILLNLMRGSGSQGLGGILPLRSLDTQGGESLLARPLLSWARRAETENYCHARGIEFRADEMNVDERFARVRVRRQLIPLLATFNPRIAETLARTAQTLRAENDFLDERAHEILSAALAANEKTTNPNLSAAESESATVFPTDNYQLDVKVLRDAAPALRRRVLRLWLQHLRGDTRRLTTAHLAGVERLLSGTQSGRVAELPGGARIIRAGARLRFATKPEQMSEPDAATDGRRVN